METIVEKYRDSALRHFMMQDKMTEKEAMRKCKKIIKEWVNAQTRCDFEYSPIHFACYYGQSDVIKLLEKYGADMKVSNKMGLTGMHIASWSDLAFPLTYLRSKGLDPDQPDIDG